MMSWSEDAPKVFEAAETTAPATGTAFPVESADLVDHCWVFCGLVVWGNDAGRVCDIGDEAR